MEGGGGQKHQYYLERIQVKWHYFLLFMTKIHTTVATKIHTTVVARSMS